MPSAAWITVAPPSRDSSRLPRKRVPRPRPRLAPPPLRRPRPAPADRRAELGPQPFDLRLQRLDPGLAGRFRPLRVGRDDLSLRTPVRRQQLLRDDVAVVP